MLRTTEEQREQVFTNVRGGNGSAVCYHLFEKEEMAGKMTMLARMVLEPGCTYGAHEHQEDAEVYYVEEGEVYSGAPGEEKLMKKGDATFTTAGEWHCLQNRSDKPAVVLSICLP